MKNFVHQIIYAKRSLSYVGVVVRIVKVRAGRKHMFPWHRHLISEMLTQKSTEHTGSVILAQNKSWPLYGHRRRSWSIMVNGNK